MTTEKLLPQWIDSMTKAEQKVILAIFYASEHPEILTDSQKLQLL